MKKADRLVEPAAAVGRLVASKTELDEVDDAISSLIADLESALRGLKLSVRFDVEMSAKPDWVELLSFAKHEPPQGQGRWRLLREGFAPAQEAETWVQTPLLDCPRDQRYEAVVQHLARIVDAAVDRLNEKVSLRKKVLSNGMSMLEALRAVKGASK